MIFTCLMYFNHRQMTPSNMSIGCNLFSIDKCLTGIYSNVHRSNIHVLNVNDRKEYHRNVCERNVYVNMYTTQMYMTEM